MALPSDPTAQQIAQEFGGATYPYNSIAEYQLAGMYNRVFGGGNHDRLRFGNTGKASIISGISVSTTDNVVTVSVGVDVGGETQNVPGYVDYYWADGDDGLPDSNTTWNKYASTSSTANGTQSWDEEFLNGDYYFMVRVYNGYMSYDGDQLEDISFDLVTLSSGGGTADNKVTNLVFISEAFGEFNHDWEYPVENHTAFELQAKYDTESNWQEGNLSNLTSTGTNYNGDFSHTNLPSGDESSIEFRIRGGANELWAISGPINL